MARHSGHIHAHSTLADLLGEKYNEEEGLTGGIKLACLPTMKLLN